MIEKFDFNKTKYNSELLVDLIRLESLEKYITKDNSHLLTYYDITLIQEGRGKITIDNSTFNIQENMVICSSPMQIRKWSLETIPKGLVLIFEEEFLSAFFNDTDFVRKLKFFHTILNEPILLLSDAESDFFENLLLNIEREIPKFTPENDHILRALLYQVLAWLNREYTKHVNQEEEKSINDIVYNFKKLVNKYYCKEHSVSFYAENLNITSGYLNDLIKKDFKISAKKFIQDRVHLEAKKLLRHTSLTVSEIAWKLNFNDDSYFIRAFKNRTGFTPKSYRNINNP